MNISSFTSEQRRAVVVLLIASLSLALFFFYSARGEAVPQVVPVSTSPEKVDPPITVIYIDVTGRVKVPGVYQLPEGSRVIDAIEIAGGLKRGFSASHINLARRLVDGEQVAITSKKFQAVEPPTGRRGIFTGKVSINSGTRAQFDSLPGIGPVLAQRIIDHRNKNGSFAKLEDIQSVSGIGAAIFAKISARLTL